MWQITWMLGLLPDWFWTLFFVLGLAVLIAAWVLKFVPFISTYRLPLQVAGVIITMLGTWQLGAASNEEKWQARIQELEKKIAAAEEKSRNANGEIQEKIIEKTRVVRERGQDIIKYVDREVVKKEEVIRYVERCPVPQEVIDAHNAATLLNRAAQPGEKR